MATDFLLTSRHKTVFEPYTSRETVPKNPLSLVRYYRMNINLKWANDTLDRMC